MKIKTGDVLVVGLAGVAVILILKASGVNVGAKAAAAIPALSNFKIPNPFVFDTPGTPYNPADPGQYLWTNDLITGTLDDIYKNDKSSYATPTINNIVEDVLSDLYGVKKSPMATW